MSNAAAAPGNLYRCNLGHEFRVESGTWTSMKLTFNGDVKDYQFCMHCFGAWAERQWPLTCEPIPPAG